MPTYFFNLTTRDGKIHDPQGTDLPNDAAALEHARIVANELLRNREPERRHWRLDVYDGDRGVCFNLRFATVDPSIDHLTPELRRSLEDVHAKSASLFEAISAVRLTLLQVKGTLARAEGAPYLAAIKGVTIQ
jgi:hypothetical protein